MTIELFIVLAFFFVLGVPGVLLMAVHREFGVTNQSTGLTTVSGKVMLTTVTFLVIYICLALHYGRTALDHYFPLVKHSATVCEVKTTYLRKGIK